MGECNARVNLEEGCLSTNRNMLTNSIVLSFIFPSIFPVLSKDGQRANDEKGLLIRGAKNLVT
jgi:hypothetical protein